MKNRANRSTGKIQRSNPNIVRILGNTAGLILLVYLVIRYDPLAIGKSFIQSDIPILLTVILLYILQCILSAVAMLVLLGSPPQGGVSVWGRLRVLLAIQPLALAIPGRLSDLGLVPLLETHYKRGKIVSAILVDKLISLLILGLLTPMVLNIATRKETLSWFFGSAILVAGSIATPIVLLNQRIRSTANHFILKRYPALLAGFGESLEGLIMESKQKLLANFVLTAAKILLNGFIIALLARNAGVVVTIPTAIAIVVSGQIATLLPISVMGIGIADGSVVLLFALNGLSEAAAITICLMGRVISVAILVVIYYWITLPVWSSRLGGKRQ